MFYVPTTINIKVRDETCLWLVWKQKCRLRIALELLNYQKNDFVMWAKYLSLIRYSQIEVIVWDHLVAFKYFPWLWTLCEDQVELEFQV